MKHDSFDLLLLLSIYEVIVKYHCIAKSLREISFKSSKLSKAISSAKRQIERAETFKFTLTLRKPS